MRRKSEGRGSQNRCHMIRDALTFVTYLQSKGYVSTRDLMQDLNMSRRTAQRWITSASDVLPVDVIGAESERASLRCKWREQR